MNAVTPSIALRALTLAPSTLDREARTVEAIAATTAPVKRLGPAGVYEERLGMDPANINLSRVPRVPLLDGHRQTSSRDQLGIVTGARVQDGQLIVTIRIARGPEGDTIIDKIEDGMLTGVSAGYTVEEWREGRMAGGTGRSRRPGANGDQVDAARSLDCACSGRCRRNLSNHAQGGRPHGTDHHNHRHPGAGAGYQPGGTERRNPQHRRHGRPHANLGR